MRKGRSRIDSARVARRTCFQLKNYSMRVQSSRSTLRLQWEVPADGKHSTAEVAELADALASGASGRKAIGVRVPASAPVREDRDSTRQTGSPDFALPNN